MILTWTCSVWPCQLLIIKWWVKKAGNLKTHQEPGSRIAELGASSRQKQLSTQKALCVSLLTVCSLCSPQRSWVEVCMLIGTSSCVTQTQSIGRTLSKIRGSILWWCPPTAVSHVSNPVSTSVEDKKIFVLFYWEALLLLHTYTFTLIHSWKLHSEITV